MADQASESTSSFEHPLKVRSVSDYREHARERLKQFEADRKTAADERKAGRLLGKLSDSLCEKLEACNPLQLREVVKLARKYQKLHREPPSLYKCGMKYTVEIIRYVDVRNKRFTLEFRRTTKQAERVYIGGPYVAAYWRDGTITKQKYFGNKNLRQRLPRKVWNGFRELLVSAEISERRQKLNEQWQSGYDGE